MRWCSSSLAASETVVSRSPAVFDVHKLRWMGGEHLRAVGAVAVEDEHLLDPVVVQALARGDHNLDESVGRNSDAAGKDHLSAHNAQERMAHQDLGEELFRGGDGEIVRAVIVHAEG